MVGTNEELWQGVSLTVARSYVRLRPRGPTPPTSQRSCAQTAPWCQLRGTCGAAHPSTGLGSAPRGQWPWSPPGPPARGSHRGEPRQRRRAPPRRYDGQGPIPLAPVAQAQKDPLQTAASTTRALIAMHPTVPLPVAPSLPLNPSSLATTPTTLGWAVDRNQTLPCGAKTCSTQIQDRRLTSRSAAAGRSRARTRAHEQALTAAAVGTPLQGSSCYGPNSWKHIHGNPRLCGRWVPAGSLEGPARKGVPRYPPQTTSCRGGGPPHQVCPIRPPAGRASSPVLRPAREAPRLRSAHAPSHGHRKGHPWRRLPSPVAPSFPLAQLTADRATVACRPFQNVPAVGSNRQQTNLTLPAMHPTTPLPVAPSLSPFQHPWRPPPEPSAAK